MKVDGSGLERIIAHDEEDSIKQEIMKSEPIWHGPEELLLMWFLHCYDEAAELKTVFSPVAI